jgi:quercetin dioxygenase-like cupin family protein
MSEVRQEGSRFFDMEAPPDPNVAIADPSGGARPEFVGPYFGTRVRSHDLVTNPESDGMRLTIFRIAPGTVFPRHSHDVDYIEFILEGEVHHGNKVVRRGAGVYRKAGTPYTFTAGPEGAVIADFRAQTFYGTTWVDDPTDWPPHRDWNDGSEPNG